MGPMAAIGIIKGKPFAPDERMKRIMTEALALANATSRSLFMNPREPSWFYYPDSAWFNYLFETGSEFETPIPEITPEGVKPFPATGYRTMNARTASSTASPASRPHDHAHPRHRVAVSVVANGCRQNNFDGAKTYKVTLPKGIPEANFWSFTLYDNLTRSMLDTPQRYPRAAARAILHQPPKPTQMARRRYIRPNAARGSEARQLDTNHA